MFRFTRLAAVSLAFLFTVSLTLSSCAPKKTVRTTSAEDDTDAGLTDDINEDGLLDISGVDVEEPNVRDKSFQIVEELREIRFDYDTYRLSRNARLTLRENATYLKAKDKLHVLIEGHADDRGTTEYNVALAQKRARAVREYYMRLGLAGGRMATVSYGEEKSLCYDPREDCWRRNRRAVTQIESGRVNVQNSVDVDLDEDDVEARENAEREDRRGWRR